MTGFVSRHQRLAINKNASSKNKRVLIALGLWFGLAAVFFAWFGVQNHQFTSQLQQTKNSIKSTVGAAPVKVKAAHDAGDANAMATALRDLSAAVSQNLKGLPAAPSIAGLYVGADAERNERQQLRAAAEAYAADLDGLADFLTYQTNLARHLQSLSLKDATGYDQTVALADAWRDAAKSVQNERKPTHMTSVTATLVQKMKTIEMTIREMAELYKKADGEGFKAKQTALAATITELKAIGTQISAIAVQFDAELAASSAKLRQNL